MADPSKVQRDIHQGSDQQSKNLFTEPLSTLRGYGNHISRMSPEDVDTTEFLYIKNLLLELRNDLERELNNNENLDGKKVEKIDKIISHITYDIIPDIGVLNAFLNSAPGPITSFSPSQVLELFRMIASIGKKLKDLPKNI